MRLAVARGHSLVGRAVMALEDVVQLLHTQDGFSGIPLPWAWATVARSLVAGSWIGDVAPRVAPSVRSAKARW